LTPCPGGPDRYDGRDLGVAHAGLAITDDAYQRVSLYLLTVLHDFKVPMDVLQVAEVIAHERRTADIAVLTVRPMLELRYRAGQSVAVESQALLQRIAEEVAARDGQISGLLSENDRLRHELFARRHGQLPASAPHGLDETMIARQIQASPFPEPPAVRSIP